MYITYFANSDFWDLFPVIMIAVFMIPLALGLGRMAKNAAKPEKEFNELCRSFSEKVRATANFVNYANGRIDEDNYRIVSCLSRDRSRTGAYTGEVARYVNEITQLKNRYEAMYADMSAHLQAITSGTRSRLSNPGFFINEYQAMHSVAKNNGLRSTHSMIVDEFNAMPRLRLDTGILYAGREYACIQRLPHTS